MPGGMDGQGQGGYGGQAPNQAGYGGQGQGFGVTGGPQFNAPHGSGGAGSASAGGGMGGLLGMLNCESTNIASLIIVPVGPC